MTLHIPPSLLRRIAVILLALGLAGPAPAQGLETHDLGEVTFAAPADWQVTSEIRERRVILASPDARLTLAAFWWIADEPLLGWPEEVQSGPVVVAGQPATFVHSLQGATRSMMVVLDEPRPEDGYRLLFDLSGEGIAAGDLQAALWAILGSISFDGSGAPETPLILPQVPGTAPTAAPAPPDAEEAIFDAASGIGLLRPAGWALYTADQPGARLLTLVSPDARALMIVALSPDDAAAQRTEDHFFSQWVVPRSIEADDRASLAGHDGSVLTIIARIYAPAGTDPAFDRAVARVFRGRDAAGGRMLVATLRPEDDPGADARLAQMMASVTRGAAPVAPLGTAALSPDTDALAVWTPMLEALFGGDCVPADATWFASGPGAVFARHGYATAEWALSCKAGALPVFGMDFAYDMRGPTGDYFTPLFLDLLDVVPGGIFVAIETTDLTVAVVEGGGDSLDIRQDDLPDPRAYAASLGATAPAETAPQPVPEPEAAALPDLARTVPQGELLAALPHPNWLPLEADGGSFEGFARSEAGSLTIEVPAGSRWGTTGIRTAGAVVTGPRIGSMQRITVGLDPARTAQAWLALVPPDRAGEVDRDVNHYRLGVDLADPAAPAVRLWLGKAKVLDMALPSVEAAREVTMEMYPQGYVRLFDATGAVLGDAVFAGHLQAGYVLYALAESPDRASATRAAFTRIAVSTHPWEPGPAHDRFAYGPEMAPLFDGKGLGPHFRRLLPRGTNFSAEEIRIAEGALAIDLPEGQGAAQLGIYSPEPVVWPDRLTPDGAATVTVELDPARTSGMVLALSVPRASEGIMPTNPTWFMHWRRAADGTGRISTWHDSGRDLVEMEAPGILPDQITLGIREGRVDVRGQGLPEIGIPWPGAAGGQGLRLFAFTQPDQPGMAVQMAIRSIRVGREPGGMVSPDPAPGVAPLPARALFDGTASDAWKPVGLRGGDPASVRFADGWMLATTDGTARDAAAGLVSAAPVAVLDHRLQRTPFRIALTLDPARTEGLQLYLSPQPNDDMISANEAAVVFQRAADGVHAGDWQMTLAAGYWPTWSRWIDDRWLTENWTGEIVLRLGVRWVSVVLPAAEGPPLELRGTGFTSDLGKSFHLSVLSVTDAIGRPGNLTLGPITAGWETPPGMDAAARFGLVDDAEFDVEAFLGAALEKAATDLETDQ
ncbi:hypothetical protein GVY41_01420 [Frigidibacter albus]|uniref:Uncharacterized protein n=1 Tax=Frigidibacter albus TaxID=1465486 RepID=A0A6L8VBW4_9RHOB|nr:hypothetical protein [Frigidibacter albus]MZQ87753.1 hypothetical protein [Frigidibacter albus]NBE29659.1 hypothetical protein [Frigidibacter albus]GGH43517.1 hypothetical protein GCM10011341_02240 [Frigidibacter albus]